MATAYTTIYDVLKDSALYLLLRRGGDLTLGLFPSIARERWVWFVNNYTALKERFEVTANGNIELVKLLADLNKQVDGYNLGNTKINPFGTESIFAKYRPFLDQILLSEMQLSPAEIAAKDEEMERINKFEEVDFRNMLSLLRKQTAIFAQEIGLGDATADAFLGISARKKRRSATIQDITDIASVNKVYELIEGFIFDKQRTQKRTPNLLQIAQENSSSDSGFIPENIYETYYPVPFEISLESMAKKYLGSTQKWFELATINNLQPPFIDEVGEKFTPIAPPASNSLIILGSLYDSVGPGVRVSIGSFSKKEESRVIESVVLGEDGNMAIALSGEPNLSKFLPSEGAYVRIYKPGTVRSNSMMLIPSSATSSADGSAKPTPSKDEIRRLEDAFIQFGVDIARDEKTGDVIFDSNGNFKLSYGIRAVRQAVLNVLKTEINELPFHPTYGINYSLGRSYMGSVDEAVKIGDLIISSVLSDARMEDTKITRISSTENGAALQMAVKIKGLDTLIPLSFIT